MAIYDLFSGKTLETLKAELKDVADDINHQNQLLLRHMKAPVGIEMEGVDLKPMIADNIERLEGKRALLVIEIDKREAYQRMPHQQHGRLATQLSRPSQSGKIGNNIVNPSIVPRPPQIQDPGYSPYGVYYPVNSSQGPPFSGSSPTVAPPGQYPNAQQKQPRSFGATNQAGPVIPGLPLANQPSSLYRAPGQGTGNQNTTPSSVSFEFDSDIFASAGDTSGHITPVSMAANPLLSRTHQPSNRETKLFEPKLKTLASSSSSSIVDTLLTDAVDCDEGENGAGAILLDRLLGTSAVKRKHELEEENEESERQLEVEKMLKAQREVEDEEFARRLQEEEYSENSGQPTPLSQSPSLHGSRGPAMFGWQSLQDIGLGNIERRGSNDSSLSWNMPSPERRPSTASSASMGPPPLPLLPPHIRCDSIPSLGQHQSVTQHHAAGQPQQPPSNSFFQNLQNQARNPPSSTAISSNLFRGPHTPSLSSRMRRPHQALQTPYAPQSSPTPVIDLTNLDSDSEHGTSSYQQPISPIDPHQQYHDQGLPRQQSNTATVWHQEPHNQEFQPQQANNPGVSLQQPINQMFPLQQQNTPGLPYNSQHLPFSYEQPNTLGFPHTSQYAFSHQQPNAPRFPNDSQYSPFQPLQLNTPGFPLLQSMGNSVTNTGSPIPFGFRQQPVVSQQEHSLRLSQSLQDTGSTVSNLGSSLVGGGAAGMINSAYDSFQGGYNALRNQYAGSSTSAYDVSRSGTHPSSSRSGNNMPDTTPNEDLKQLLDNILPDGSFADREGTPEAMAGNLYEHQKVGLAWMKSMEKGSNKGGILADDMGLGKTIQALALMVSNRSPEQKCKTTLIVCTVALVEQWKTEIQEKVKPDFEHRLSVFVYHNDTRKTQWQSLKQYDVVLTTYGTVAAEYKRYIEVLGKDDGEDGAEDDERTNQAKSEGSGVSRTMALASEDKSNLALPPRNANLPLLGRSSLWYRVILDEAQNVKNKNTKASQAVCALKSTYRWCMTGTPMMNGIEELYSLIKFLAIKPYCDHLKFKEDFSRHLTLNGADVGDKREQAMSKLHVLLKALMLRRTKNSKIDGMSILTLPEKNIEVRHCVFSSDEKEFYQALEGSVQAQFNKYLKAGSVMKHYTAALTLLLRLRQACCHPHLIKDFGAEISADVSMDQLLKVAKELDDAVISRIKSSEGFECPACFDAINNPILLRCGHSTCAECFARITDPTQRLDGPTRTDFTCPECRAVINPKKITDLDSFNKVHRPEMVVEKDGEEDSDSDSESEDYGDEEGLEDFVVPDDEVQYEIDIGEAADSGEKTKRKRSSGGGPSTIKRTKLGKEPSKRRKPRVTLAQLKKNSMKNARAKNKYLKRLRKEWVTSAKIEKTMELLGDVAERNAQVDKPSGKLVKTIIFSQFTSLLDLLEIPISDKGWGYRRYDGSMSSKLRNQAISDFKTDEKCTIMLVSLKAGNAGLNLTVASQVIIFDPFWNPFVEDQAVDRAYRIGQLLNVTVHRILVPDTVEDRIQALQERKRELIEGALDESASQGVSRLDPNQLAYLFGIRR